PLPERILALPVDPARGYPVPWFVTWMDGKPEFRVADGAKFRRAVNESLCWVCRQSLGRFKAFVVGPICTVNRIGAAPPCHLVCAEYADRACPFLSKPQMVRRENDLPPPEMTGCAGHMITRNPGCSAVWVTREHRTVSDGKGGLLFRLGVPTQVS